jgi:hypothetical protein
MMIRIIKTPIPIPIANPPVNLKKLSSESRRSNPYSSTVKSWEIKQALKGFLSEVLANFFGHSPKKYEKKKFFMLYF